VVEASAAPLPTPPPAAQGWGGEDTQAWEGGWGREDEPKSEKPKKKRKGD
jgi:hypothetical protein